MKKIFSAEEKPPISQGEVQTDLFLPFKNNCTCLLLIDVEIRKIFVGIKRTKYRPAHKKIFYLFLGLFLCCSLSLFASSCLSVRP